jgi:hypothetical protein
MKTLQGRAVSTTAPSDDQLLVYNSTGVQWEPQYESGAIGITIDGGGSAITTGVKGYIRVPQACEITSATLLAKESGSIVVDVWVDSSTFPPTDADSITASAPPTLSSNDDSTDSTLTGWTPSVATGAYVGFNVDSATTVTHATLIMPCRKKF